MERHAAAQAAIERLLTVMDKLRDPGGCPWDREQTLRTLTPYLLEEAHEVIEAIEAGDVQHHKEELGDLLFQVVFQARIASESHQFDFAQVCDAIADKLTRRHPHVFGDVSVSGSREVVKNWERIKADERTAKGEAPRSAIGGVPVGLPALVRAERVTEKAAAVGFDWPDLAGVLAKVREELGELEAAIVQHPPGAAAPDEAGGGGVPPPPGGTRRAEQMTEEPALPATGGARRAQQMTEEPALPATGGARRAQQTIAHELGDLLFALANLGRFVNVHPEEALRGAIRRFESRFHHVEARLREQGRTPREATLAEMDGHWDEAKRLEKARKTPS